MGCGASKDSAVNATPDSRVAECCNSKKKKKRIKHKDEEKEVPHDEIEVGAVSTLENPVPEVPSTIDETPSGNAGVVELNARAPSPLQQDNFLQNNEQVVACSPKTEVRTPPPPVEQGHDEPQTEVITPEKGGTPQKDVPERALDSPAAENETKIHITAPSPLRLRNQASRTPSPAPRAKIVAGSRSSSPGQLVAESRTSSPAQSVSRTSSPAPLAESKASSAAQLVAESRTSSAQLVANSRTSSPAQLVTESRTSSPAQVVSESRNSSPAQLVAESRTSSPAQLVPKSRSSSPLVAGSRTSSPAHPDLRTSSPAPDSRALSPAQLAAESRTSSLAHVAESRTSSSAQLVPESRTSSPAHVAESRTSSSAQLVPESRTSSPAESRTSSPAQSKASSPVQLAHDFKSQLNRTPSPAQIALSQASRSPSPAQSNSESMGYASRSASPAQLSELKGQVSRTASAQLSEASTQLSESKSLLSRTPSPAQVSTVPRRTPSPAPQIPVSKIELRKPSPAEQIALSQEKLKSQFRSPSPAEQQDKLHINLTKELPLSRPQSNNEQHPVDAHNGSRTLSRSSVVSLKDSRSSSRSPALSQKDSTPSSKSPAMSRQDSRASSQSPALSRKASFGLADEEGNLLSESAAAALRAIVQSVTDELSEKAGNDHDLHEDEAEGDVESSATKERDEVDALKKEKNLEAEREADEHENDEMVSPPSNDAGDLTASQHLESILSRLEVKKKQQNVAAAAAGATGSSPRPGLLQYYLGLRSGEYKLSSPSSSASSQRDSVAGIKDALEDIDLPRDLPDNGATSPKVSSPALDVESIYNEIRKLTFSEYDKLEDTNSNYEGSIEQVEIVSTTTTTKAQMLVEKEQVSSPLSSKDSVDEGVPDAPSLTNTRLSSILDEYAET